MRYAAIAIFLLFSQIENALATQSQHTEIGVEILASLMVLHSGGEYVVDVVESDRRGTDRRLRIRCRFRCSGFTPFQEPASGFPLGIYTLSSQYRLILVIWGGATSTTLQVFEIGDRRAAKVFDRHSIGPPQIAGRTDGSPTLTTTEFPRYGAGPDRPLITRNWVWDGHRFLEADGQ